MPLILVVPHCFAYFVIPLAGQSAIGPWFFIPTKLTTGSATKFAAHKTREIGFPQFRRPLCQGFHRPFCHSFRVLSLLGPKINHNLSLTSLATFDIYIYLYITYCTFIIYIYIHMYMYICIFIFLCFFIFYSFFICI